MDNPSALSKKTYTKEKYERSQYKSIIISSIVLISVLLISNVLSIFMLYYLNSGVLILASIAIIIIGIMFVKAIVEVFRYKNYKYTIQLVTTIISVYIIAFQPLRMAGVALDYNYYKAEREEVINQMTNGTLLDEVIYNDYTLPDKYAHLSKDDGKVLIDISNGQLKVCFLTTRGIWKAYPAFIYSSKIELADNHMISMKYVKNVEKKDPHWYWANIANGK